MTAVWTFDSEYTPEQSRESNNTTEDSKFMYQYIGSIGNKNRNTRKHKPKHNNT